MKTMPELNDTDCRFIEGEPDGVNTVYCGQPAKPGSSYCAEHHTRCYEKPRPRRKRTDYRPRLAAEGV